MKLRSRLKLLALLAPAFCLAALILASLGMRHVTASLPIQLGGTEITFEIDRSPECPNRMLGMCLQGGRGPNYLSIWRYAWSAPNTLNGQRLLALPIAP
jgi:hypothetical protein